MNLLQILKFAEEYLSKYSFSKPRVEAENLISYVLKLDRMGLYTSFDLELKEEEKEKIKKYLREMGRNKVSFKDLDKVEEKSYLLENSEILDKSIKYLSEKGVPSPKVDAEEIFSHALGVKRSLLRIILSKEIEESVLVEIRRMIKERGMNRKPLQQIIGEWEFYGYTFKVNEHVLIPRSDTENLVEQCKFLMLDIENPSILDIGTGSGAIAITLKKEVPNSSVTAVDISEEALNMAKINSVLNSAEVTFVKSNVLDGISKETKFNLIVSNPPYIPLTEYEDLMIEVKKYEPKLALTDNGDGYFFYDKISRESSDYLLEGGYLAFEVGYNQAEKVAEMMVKNKFKNIRIVKDLGGVDRVVIGVKLGDEDVNEIK